MTEEIQQAADRLWEAGRSGVPCQPVRDLIGELDLSAAYQAQEINTERRLSEGHRLVGRKVGLTAKTVQQQLGVSQPDYGMLFDHMDVRLGEEIPLARVCQPRVEAEIAFVIGRDLDSERLTSADMLSAVEYVVAALEIVDSRVANWDISICDTIADNASSGLFVLGDQPRKLGEIDVRLCGMVMERRGVVVSLGAGAACLGSPVASALWLAKVMAAAGRPLRSGDIVLTGALGPVVPIEPGDAVTAQIGGLGSVSALFSS